jgi:hypothetical protein
MRRLWLVVAGAVLALGLSAAPALAELVRAWLIPSQTVGYYGQDCSMAPVLNVPVVPGDRVEFQVYNRSAGEWEKYEDQVCEEADVIDPMYIQFNEELSFPLSLRAVYRAKASDFSTGAVSPTVKLSVLKHLSSKTVVSAPKQVRTGKRFTTSVSVVRNPGPGTVSIKIHKLKDGKWAYVTSRTATLDDAGEGAFRFTPGSKTKYRITAKFAGNRFSVASPSSVAYFTAR